MKQKKYNIKSKSGRVSAFLRGAVGVAFVSLALGLASCNDREETMLNDLPAGEYPVEFQASTIDAEGNITKGMAPGTAITVKYEEVGNSNLFSKSYKSLNDGRLAPIADADKLFWLRSTQSYRFFAYNQLFTGLLTDQSAPANYQRNDIMFAPVIEVSYANRNASSSALVFRHELSHVVVNLEKGENFTDDQIKNATVTILGTSTRATMAVATIDGIGFNGLSAVAPITPYRESDTRHCAIVFPQILVPGTQFIKIEVAGYTYYYSLPAAREFEKGKQYNYNIRVNLYGIDVYTDEIIKWTVPEINSKQPTNLSYVVGDYYPDPTNAATAIGVVFWIDPTSGGKSGKIVSLDEKRDVRWDQNDAGDGAGEFNTGANSLTDGRVNMAAIKSYINANSLSWTQNFPGFAWVDAKNGEQGATDYIAGAKGLWYVPARNELQHLYCAFNGKAPQNWDYGSPSFDEALSHEMTAARAAFNAKLGTPPISSGYYWSSSEIGNKYAWNVLFVNGDSNFDLKNAYNSVRAVLAF